MQKQFTLYSMQKRVKAILLVLTILCCALGVRLFVVQIKDGKELQQRATDQWTRDLKMTAKRGSFFDCTSDAIAVSYTTYNVYVRGREVTDLEMEADTLSTILNISKDDPKHILEEVVMPDIVGKSLAEAAAELKKCGLFYEVDGNSGVVKEQLPPAGTRIYKGQTVLIVT